MKKIILVLLIIISYHCVIYAEDIMYKDTRFNGNNLVLTLSIVKIKEKDIIEALKRGLEGQITYNVEIIEDSALPLFPKTIIKSVTVKRKIRFDFFSKAYIVTGSNPPSLYYSDDALLEDLFFSKKIIIENVYQYRKLNYSIRTRITFTSVKLYFPLNLIFNYVIGIWDFDTGWIYGPKITIVPYTE